MTIATSCGIARCRQVTDLTRLSRPTADGIIILTTTANLDSACSRIRADLQSGGCALASLDARILISGRYNHGVLLRFGSAHRLNGQRADSDWVTRAPWG